MSDYSRAKKAAAAFVAVLVVSGLVIGGLVATGTIGVEQPTVESVETDWGEVTADRTGIQTTVVVDNPNPIGVPSVLDIDYEASMNSVTLASGSKSNIGLSTGRNTIDLRASIPNDRIADWWVTHINNDERSTLSIAGTVSGPAGISQDISRERTIETDILSGLTTSGETTISANGEQFLVMSGQSATWGEADGEQTPVTFTSTVQNVHDYNVTLDGMSYVVKMNNVTVGEGTTSDGVSIAPGETSEVSVEAALDTPKIADWWATHVRQNESSEITVEVYGFVMQDGERKRVPLQIMNRRMNLQTDILGGGATQVESLESPDQTSDYAEPTVGETTKEWGEVTDQVTEVRSTITVDNPNEGDINDLLRVQVGQRVFINDVVVADGASTFDDIQSGSNELVHVAELDNTKVPQWWARHINRGETSEIRIQPVPLADVGFTKFEVPVDNETSQMSTDMLAGIENDQTRELTVKDRKVGEIRSQTASWGEATPEESPFTVTVTIKNTGRVPISVSDLDYTIQMNDVTAGEGTAPESYTIQPGETRQLQFSLELDSQKMDEWWVSHIRNGEETVVDFDATVTVSAGTESDRFTVTEEGPEDTVRTDILNSSESTVASLDAVSKRPAVA